MVNTIESLTSLAEKQLTHSGTPRLDAELLLCHVLQKPRTYLWTWPEQVIDSESHQTFKGLVTQRKKNIPMAYLLGYKHFWKLRLQVNPHVLIPRPETEQLVELALQCPIPKMATVVDLGTGSGAIALALAHEKPSWQLLAVDKSIEALTVAQKNAKDNNIASVKFLLGDWFQPLEEKQRDLEITQLDMIVSNPPYIKENDEHLAQKGLQFEPTTALIAGKDGLKDIQHIIFKSSRILHPGGWLLIEHGYDQKEAVLTLFKKAHFVTICAHQDLSHSDRIVIGQKPYQ